MRSGRPGRRYRIYLIGKVYLGLRQTYCASGSYTLTQRASLCPFKSRLRYTSIRF